MARDGVRKVALEVRPGLYVLRYVGSADARTAPHATVKPSSNSLETITLVGAPGCRAEHLEAPGSTVVLVVSAPGSIEVSLTPFQDGANLDARFSLDLLASAGEAVTSAVGRSPPAEARSGAIPTLDIVAHVARRGDIAPDGQGWIAGPRAPSAIEGLDIAAQGADVGIAAQYLNDITPRAWSAWLTPGTFIGTRQKASALLGLRLKLVGADAARFEIEGEALFLGSPKLVQRDTEIEFIAPGQVDPLVGLRLSIVERASQTEEAKSSKTPRVRVFR